MRNPGTKQETKSKTMKNTNFTKKEVRSGDPEEWASPNFPANRMTFLMLFA